MILNNVFSQIKLDLDDIYKFEYNKEELFANFNLNINNSKEKLEKLFEEKVKMTQILQKNLEKRNKNDEKNQKVKRMILINSLEKDILKNSNVIENISENIGRNSKEIEILSEKYF